MRNPEVSEGRDYSLWEEDDPEEERPFTGAAPALPLVLSVGPEGARRLDKWLAEQLTQHSRERLKTWIEAGAVEVDGLKGHVRQTLYADQQVRVVPQEAAQDRAYLPEAIDLDVIAEDDALLVVNKPAGLVVHPAAGNWNGTLLNGLIHRLPQLTSLPRAGIVHRLDKDTSGLMVVAKTLESQTDLVRQLQARSVGRDYLALVAGEPGPAGKIEGAIGRDPRERTRMAVLAAEAAGAKPAITHFRLLARGHLGKVAVALLVCRLETGRTHQIRVHLSHRGWPIVGDTQYARTNVGALFPRQALHAGRLTLVHPTTRANVTWQAPAPLDMLALFQSAGVSGGLDGF
jgi:23S rRNA pseudouridine1911/1915/1917 synthase